MKIDSNIIIPLISEKDITIGLTDSEFFNSAYGVCTDYPSSI
jgi:hypothetical protein